MEEPERGDEGGAAGEKMKLSLKKREKKAS